MEQPHVQDAEDWGLHGHSQGDLAHEMVYTSEGKPASYQELTIPIFVQGFLITMELEEGPVKKLLSKHLQNLMSDAQWYGWDKVRTFHGVWLKQIEQGAAPGQIRRKSCR